MPDQFDDAPEFSLQDVMDTIRRRKWVVIQAFVFVTVIGIVTAWLSPPVYATAAKLLVDTPGSQAFQVVKMDAENPLSPIMEMRTRQNVETQIAIMRSAEFANRVHRKLPPGEMAGVKLTYSPEPQTSIVTINAEGPDPKVVARAANAAARSYQDLTDETNSQAIKSLEKYLKRSVDKAKSALEKAERDMMAFKSKTRLIDGTEIASAIMSDALEAARTARATRSEILSLESKITTLKKRLVKLPETIKEVRVSGNPEVEAVRTKVANLKAERAVLLGRFQPGSTKIVDIEEEIKSLEEVRAQLATTVRDEFEKPNPAREQMATQIAEMELNRDALREENTSQEATAQTKATEAARVAPQGVQLNSLTRALEQAEKEYEQYSSQLRDVTVRGLAGAGATAGVMEEAGIPAAPIRPHKTQQVVLAMLMGLMLGIGFAFLQEFLDDRVNNSDDIQRVLALPTLGMVPTIAEGANCLLIGQDAFSPITESYRSLRTSVQYSSVDRKVQMIGVTSAHPGEGKSVTSANLAIAMALQGKRVILVDADLRRPSVHRMFNVEAEPGLTSVLAGELELEEALRTSAIEGLRILTAGPLPPNPPELLNSQVMLDLMERMKGEVDVLIFDTPPVVPVTDAQVLGTHLDGMILVVEAGQARKAAVKHARELLDRTRVRILGVVLNKMDQSGKGYYRYYHYGAGGRSGEGYGYAPLGHTLGAENGAGARPAGEKPVALADRIRDWE